MEESYRKGLANQPDPESCHGSREAAVRSVGRGTGRPGIELRNHESGVPTLYCQAEGHTQESVQGEFFGDPAQSKTPGMFGNSVRENREALAAPAASSGPAGEGSSRTSSTNAAGESDGSVVPSKHPNKSGKPPAEGVEGRLPAKENTGKPSTPRTQGRSGVSPGLTRVREAARQASERALRRQSSEVRAVCGSTARTDLCGGRRATGVPTANGSRRKAEGWLIADYEDSAGFGSAAIRDAAQP